MASEDSSMINLSSVLDEEYNDTDDGFHYQTRQSSMSRLSICTSSLHDEEDEDNRTNTNQNPFDLGNFISELSLENFDIGAEADGEISDDNNKGRENGDDSNSDTESPQFYSLQAVTSRRRRKHSVPDGSEANEMKVDGSQCNIGRKRRVKREKNKRGNHYAPGRVSVSTGSNLETQSSGGDSPIASWRISNPGDDPSEVKARLKAWAQAVALACTSR